jgi:hypothetical protein
MIGMTVSSVKAGERRKQAYGRTLTSQYDLAGRRTKLYWPGTDCIEYVWDRADRVLQLRENGSTPAHSFWPSTSTTTSAGATIWPGATAPDRLDLCG